MLLAHLPSPQSRLPPCVTRRAVGPPAALQSPVDGSCAVLECGAAGRAAGPAAAPCWRREKRNNACAVSVKCQTYSQAARASSAHGLGRWHGQPCCVSSLPLPPPLLCCCYKESEPSYEKAAPPPRAGRGLVASRARLPARAGGGGAPRCRKLMRHAAAGHTYRVSVRCLPLSLLPALRSVWAAPHARLQR